MFCGIRLPVAESLQCHRLLRTLVCLLCTLVRCGRGSESEARKQEYSGNIGSKNERKSDVFVTLVFHLYGADKYASFLCSGSNCWGEGERKREREREREIVCSAIRQSGFVFVHLTSPICGIPKRNSTPVEEKPAFDSFPS